MVHERVRWSHRNENDADAWHGDRDTGNRAGSDRGGYSPVTPDTADHSGDWRSCAPEPDRLPDPSDEPESGNAVLEWNRIALDAIRDASVEQPPADVPYAARALALESLAVFDTLKAIEGEPGFLVTLDAPEGLSSEAAVGAAAHAILTELYPDYATELDEALETSLSTIPDGPAEDAGVAFGREVASAMMWMRADDGSDDLARVEPVAGYGPGEYRPTPPDQGEALQPHWGDVRPFVLGDGDQIRPGPPPGVRSAEYAADLAEVRIRGGAESDERTSEQTRDALWWANDAGGYTPVGQWNEIADGLLADQGRSPMESAYLLAELNVGLTDALIAGWEAKYTYGSWRPVTALHEADADGNRATSADPDWLPLLSPTPSHPEYVSGHSLIGGVADTVMTDFFGPIPFSGTSDMLPGVALHFDDFAQAAQEEADSRIYAGVHFRYSTETGLDMGEQVGVMVTDVFERFAPSQSDGLLA